MDIILVPFSRDENHSQLNRKCHRLSISEFDDCHNLQCIIFHHRWRILRWVHGNLIFIVFHKEIVIFIDEQILTFPERHHIRCVTFRVSNVGNNQCVGEISRPFLNYEIISIYDIYRCSTDKYIPRIIKRSRLKILSENTFSSSGIRCNQNDSIVLEISNVKSLAQYTPKLPSNYVKRWATLSPFADPIVQSVIVSNTLNHKSTKKIRCRNNANTLSHSDQLHLYEFSTTKRCRFIR